MVMKSHSYFRTKMLYLTDNKYKHINPLGDKAPKEVPPKINLSDFSGEVYRLSYFFIIPTLVYRDSYTLTPIRQMSKIVAHLINFLACIYYGNYLFTQHLYCMWCAVRKTSTTFRKDLISTLFYSQSLGSCFHLCASWSSDFSDSCIVGWIYGQK